MTEPETGQDDVRPDLTADAAGMQGIEVLLSDRRQRCATAC